MPLPTSTALAEASPDSLSELFSRDPAGYTQQDLGRIIETLRAQRARWAEAERLAASQPKRTTAAKAGSLIASANAEDMGL